MATSLSWVLKEGLDLSHNLEASPSQEQAFPQTGPSRQAAFPLDKGLGAYLPGPVPVGSGHLASAVPSPERWQPDCAGFPSTSQTVPSSQIPSGTRPRQRQGRQGLVGGFFLLASHWGSEQHWPRMEHDLQKN